MKDKYALLLVGVVAVILAVMCVLAQREGCIDIKTPGAVLQLKSRFGRDVALRSESGPTTVPTRTYKPMSLELTWQQGDETWQMLSRGPWGQLSRIKVVAARTTAIELGPPLLVKSRVGVYGRQVVVDMGVFGRSGEKYANVVCKNDRHVRVEAPQVKIIDEAGTVLNCGPGKYG